MTNVILRFALYGLAPVLVLGVIAAGISCRNGSEVTQRIAPTIVPSRSPASVQSPATIPAPIFRPEDWGLGPDATSLHLSALTGTTEEVKRIVAEGADVHAKTTLNSQWSGEITDATPLHLASLGNSRPAVVELLLDRGADIESVASTSTVEGYPDLESTPLFLAVSLNPGPP